MPYFTLNRTHVLSGHGHMIRFEKDEKTYVPPELSKAAVGIGAEPVDGPVDMGSEEKEAVPLSPEEKRDQFVTAFKLLIERNGREDFDGAGKPAVDAVKDLVDFKFAKKEMHAEWQRYQEAKAAESV